METANRINTKLWVETGTLRGGQIGAKLSLIYLFIVSGFTCVGLLAPSLGTFITFISNIASEQDVASPLNPVSATVYGSIIVLFMVVSIGMMTGVLPATLLGFVTGALIGGVHARFPVSRTRKSPTVVGVGIGIALAIVVHLLLLATFLGMGIDAFILGAYLFLWGVPTLVYLCAYGWLSNHLPAFVQAQAEKDGKK